MYAHLYAIVEDLPAPWRPPPTPPVVLTRVAGLTAVTSPAERVPAASAPALARHAEVVGSVLHAPAVLPFRFGIVVAAADLPGWIAAQAPSLRAGLAEVRGCVEMDVKLLRLHCAHAVGGACPACADGAPDADGLRALGDRLVDRAGVAHWRYRRSGAEGNGAASVAFLVPRREVAAFLSRIAPVASRAESIAVVPTGPWPPYSFAPPLERLPLAPADGGLPGGARTPARDAPIPHRAAGGGAGGVLPPRTRSG